VVLERTLANPAVRAYLVERLGPMFGDLPPEKLMGLQRVFGDNVMVRNGGSFAIGDAAEEVVKQELAKLGYKDIVAIKSSNGQGIDIVARSSDGSIMIFEVKGSMSNRFSSLPSNQADFEAFRRRVLDTAAAGTGGYGAEARANAQVILDAIRRDAPIHAVRVSLGPAAIASTPRISFVPWEWKK
jgi:Holliday junction resolvase-like predicted endonuclease